MAVKTKIHPKGGIKVIVSDDQGNPKILGTIAVWENASPAQKWIKENSGAEMNAQFVYISAEEEFSMDSEVKLKASETKTINSKYRVSIKEC